MSYEKQTWNKNTWIKGQTHLEEMLNHIEDGIENAGLTPTPTPTEETVWENGKGLNSIQTKGSDCRANGESSIAEGYMTEVIKSNSAIEDWNEGKGAHAEGGNTLAGGNYSHAEGNSTVTNNPYEHAQGCFNVSHMGQAIYPNSNNTIHSIGIGSNLSNAKNAVEVMQNGDVYIIGIGGYDGTNIDTAKTLQQVLTELMGN